ncbi:FAD/NAD-binding domain-containing protein [Phellopilus nigrolimitatus]|nr:FAD/NAD-binding domain-containing protein [Phellopilus nigrolimitatus]
MAPTKVALIGAGIGGPVLAMLLKQKGYEPVLYERLEKVTSAGLSLVIQPNGLKVLRLIPGLVEKIPGQRISHVALFSQMSGETLALHDGPSRMSARYGAGLGWIGVQRESFHRTLIAQAEANGIPIHWGHQLDALEQIGEDEVEMRFANGVIERTSFVVGCDGLHSSTRIALFGEMKPDFTGKVQTGGLSPRPSSMKDMDAFINVFAVSAHMVAYPISEDYYSWAVSQAEEEHQETWRSIDENQKEAFKMSPMSQWQFGAGEMVKTTTKVTKYGLYDRPELKTWYKGRVVLLGDAAHPTTPHLGQGANQAFEDVYHLVRALITHHTSPETAPSTAQLAAAFSDYESVRLPRSAALVRRARERGEQRVVDGLETAKKRDEAVRASSTEENIWHDTDEYARGPYEGESEI